MIQIFGLWRFFVGVGGLDWIKIQCYKIGRADGSGMDVRGFDAEVWTGLKSSLTRWDEPMALSVVTLGDWVMSTLY